MKPVTVRIARPSDDLNALREFYREGLGMEVLYEFAGHDGFDGIMLGHRGAPYHFEFTKKHGHHVGRAPTEENLTVFYLPDFDDWNSSITRMQKAGFAPVQAFNPYWDRSGKTFEDPDSYRIVLQHAAWE